MTVGIMAGGIRKITESITFAHEQLKKARQDGSCETIVFWAHRLDELLDEMPRKSPG